MAFASLLQDHTVLLLSCTMSHPGFENVRKVYDLTLTKLTPDQALECLLTHDDSLVSLPTPNVRACNNLDEYMLKSTSKSSNITANGKLLSSTSEPKYYDCANRFKKSTGSTSFSNEPLATPLNRNFDRILKKTKNADGELVPVPLYSTKKAKIQQDVFSKMDTASLGLSLLKDKLDKKVKILIRRRRKCPYISRVIEYMGQLVLFDKHMNIYLRNVIESFSYNIGDKLVKRARHRDNIMIRGDNIILIS